MKTIVLTLLSLSCVVFTFAQHREPVFSKFQAPFARVKTSIPVCAYDDYTWDASNSLWSKVDKGIFKFDENNNFLSSLKWLIKEGVQENSMREKWSYSTTGKILNYSIEKWSDYKSVWVNERQILNTYDSIDRLSSATNQLWDSVNNHWMNYDQMSYTYKTDSIVYAIEKSWDDINDVWQNSWRNLSNYSSKEKRWTTILQDWNKSSSDWVNSMEYDSFYDDKGNSIKLITKYWDLSSNEWILNEQFLITFNADNNIVFNFTLRWNVVDMTWNNDFKDSIVYDGDDIQFRLQQSWSKIAKRWDSTYREHYTYPDNTVVMISENWNAGWLNSKKSISYHDCPTTGIINSINEQEALINVFPNPSTGRFNFSDLTSRNNIVIYDVEGKQVNQTITTERTTIIDLSGKSSGIYYYSLSNKNGNTKSGKLILK